MLRIFALLLLPLLTQLAASSESTKPHADEAKLFHFKRGDVPVAYFRPVIAPRAIMVFGSGDGGLSDFERTICRWMADAGIMVACIDLAKYAATDYDFDTLGADYANLAESLMATGKNASLPLIYGGWSMGGTQAVAAAAWPGKPENLVSLFLLSADSRGRFGLRNGDMIGVTPTGPGTFGVSDYSQAVDTLRVIQFHGGIDFISSTAWVRNLKSPHKVVEVPGANHGFDGPSPSFAEPLTKGLDWALGDDSVEFTEVSTLPFGLSPLWPASLLTLGFTLFFLFSHRHSIRLLVISVGFIGAINLLEACLPRSADDISWMEQWLPFSANEHSRLFLFLSGFMLLAIARALGRKKKVAWWIAVILLIATVGLHLARAFDWHHSLVAAILLAPLIRWRKRFTALSDAPSFRFGLKVGVIGLLAILVYGVITLRESSERGDFGEGLSWSDCLRETLLCITGVSSDLQKTANSHGLHSLNILNTGGLITAAAILSMILRPVLASRIPKTREDLTAVQRIISAWGSDPMDPYAELDDKHYFFNADQTAVIAYKLWRNIAVVLADPIGPEDSKSRTAAAFVAFCHRQDWAPAFYCTHVSNRPTYVALGLVTFKIGEDARLMVNDFSLAGGKFQNIRTGCNKAKKEGYSFGWYGGDSALDAETEKVLTDISDRWLAEKNGAEMSFDLGAFDLESIRKHGAALIRNVDGRVDCFATWHSYARGHGRSLDLMRHRPEIRGMMDFLIVSSIDYFKKLGVTEISLGNAPLANTETDESKLLRQERAVKFVYEHFNRLYGYKSLFEFKRKYHPQWQGRYLAIESSTPVAAVALAIASVHLPRGLRSLIKS